MNDPLEAVRSRFATGKSPSISVPVGWYGIVADLDVALVDAMPDIKYLGITQKQGGLRVYVQPWDAQVDALIWKAEQRADRTCEKCGAPGILRQYDGKLMRVCDSCKTRRGKVESDV